MILFIKRYFFEFKYFVRFRLPDRHWQFFAKFVQPFRAHKYQEMQKSYGELNPNITFFVIRRRPPAWGYFSNVNYVLQGILYAEKNGYTPIVDMENYWVAELSSRDKINGTYNAWCYLFNQISNYSLDEVYKSKNVILSRGAKILQSDHWFSNRQLLFMTDSDKLQIVANLVTKYLMLNESSQNYIKAKKQELYWNGNDTVGVFVRGTSYLSYRGAQAPSASLEFIISSIKELLDYRSINKLFISTEDFFIYRKLCEAFDDKIIIPSLRHPKNMTAEKWLDNQKLTFDDAIILGYEKTLIYLAEIFLLSDCSSFIGTLSNASAFALALNNNNYKDCRVILQNKVKVLK